MTSFPISTCPIHPFGPCNCSIALPSPTPSTKIEIGIDWGKGDDQTVMTGPCDNCIEDNRRLAAENARMKAEIDRLTSGLEEIQWIEWNDRDYECRICMGQKSDGHVPDCEIAALLSPRP